jgi:hypothetical protein
MSEARFDRIESQIARLSEFMQQNITVIQQDITSSF